MLWFLDLPTMCPQGLHDDVLKSSAQSRQYLSVCVCRECTLPFDIYLLLEFCTILVKHHPMSRQSMAFAQYVEYRRGRGADYRSRGVMRVLRCLSVMRMLHCWSMVRVHHCQSLMRVLYCHLWWSVYFWYALSYLHCLHVTLPVEKIWTPSGNSFDAQILVFSLFLLHSVQVVVCA